MTSKTAAPEPVKSTQQLDLEARQAEDYVSPIAKAKTVGPNETLVNDDGFVGVSPEYANNANETDAPLSSDEGVEKVLEDKFLGEPEAPQTDGPVQTAAEESTPAPTEESSTAKHAAAPTTPTTAPSTPTA